MERQKNYCFYSYSSNKPRQIKTFLLFPNYTNKQKSRRLTSTLDNQPPAYEIFLFQIYFIMSTERFKKASSAAPFSMPFCSKARSMS